MLAPCSMCTSRFPASIAVALVDHLDAERDEAVAHVLVIRLNGMKPPMTWFE